MSHQVLAYVNLDGVPPNQQVGMVLKSLKKTGCPSRVMVRRAKSSPWIQIDGLWPQEAETVAAAVSAEIKTMVALIEHESTSDALRLVKFDWKDGQYGQPVLQWVYGCEQDRTWETCLGDPEDGLFSLITAPPTDGKTTSARNSSKFVVPRTQLRSPDPQTIAQHLRLPGFEDRTSDWTDEKEFAP